MDELWSFVDHKGNKQWVWLALDADTREVIGCHIGDPSELGEANRSRESARALWASLPSVYRQCATVYTDFGEAYETVIPAKRHRAVGKECGLTSYIERFNPPSDFMSFELTPLSFNQIHLGAIRRQKEDNQPLLLPFWPPLSNGLTFVR